MTYNGEKGSEKGMILQTGNAVFFIQINGKLVKGIEDAAKEGLAVTVEKSSHNGSDNFAISFRNTGNAGIYVGKAGIVLKNSSRKAGRKWRIFIDSGQCGGWCGVKRLDCLEDENRMQPSREQRLEEDDGIPLRFHRSDMQTVLWDPTYNEAILAGYLGQKNGINGIDTVINTAADDFEQLTAWQEFNLYISPDGIQRLDTLVVMEGGNPYSLLEQFGMDVMQNNSRVFEAPPVVGMMTWYGYGTAVDEESVLANAEIIGGLFGGYPKEMRNILLIDHGWQEDANWGYWEADRKRFPHGLAWLSSQLARHGMELGLWYTPFCITENAPGYESFKSLMALDGNGEPYKGEACVWGELPGHKRRNWPVRYFDGVMEAVRKKWAAELSDMKKKGAVYVKLDFFVLRTRYENARDIGMGKLYAMTWRNFRHAAGIELHLAPCSSRTNIQAGYADSVRIAADIGKAGLWPETMESFKYSMTSIASLWYKHRRFWVNDPDSVQIGSGCSLAEVRVRSTVAALSGGHFMLSEDLRFVDNERIEMIRRLIPQYPYAARPINLFENPYPEGYPSIWRLHVNTVFGKLTVLAVFNLSTKSGSFEIKPKMLDMKPGAEFMVLEWWNCKWLGKFKGAFFIDVPAGDVAVLHVREVEKEPSLLSVSHHITGGYIVEAASFNKKTGKLTGKIASKAGLKLALFGMLPAGWTIPSFENPHVFVNSMGGWQMEMVMEGMYTGFEIIFRKGKNKKGENKREGV